MVKDFFFLGSKIDHTGETTPEIKRRIAIVHNAWLTWIKSRKVRTFVLPPRSGWSKLLFFQLKLMVVKARL